VLTLRKVKIYAVGMHPNLLPEQVNEVEFDGHTIEDLLRCVRSCKNGRTLYDEVIDKDGSYKYGYALAINGELFRADQLGEPIPNPSEIVIIHLVQIPAGG
jgi:hypothetical protein